MKELLEYREINYFNTSDLYLIYTPLGKYYVTKVKNDYGFWYCVEGLKYRMSSIKSINCNEVYHKEIAYLNIEVKGTITKFMEPNNIGVNWSNGANIKKYGLPHYWNNPSKLKL